jgi:hypothetical protein
LGRRWRSPRSHQCSWTASSIALRKKTCLSMVGVANLALSCVCGFLPGLTKNWPLPWSTEEDARGRRAGTTPLRHRGTSLSWRGRRTAPRKKNGDVAAGPPPCRTPPRVAGHTCDGDEAATETRKAEAEEEDRRRKAGQSVY